jgi:protein DGCR14
VTHPERSHGYTPLHNAAWAGSGNLVELLIERGHPVDVVDPVFSSTPLGFMMYDMIFEKRHPEGEFARVTKALLDAGSPWQPLDYPTGEESVDAVLRPRLSTRIDGAALLGESDRVFELLGSQPDEESRSLALAGAAQGGHAGLVRRLLAAGAPVNRHFGSDQDTPLMRALKSDSHDTVAMLLEAGADLHAKNVYDTLPLHFAAGYNARLETVKLLLDRGAAADIDTPNKNGRSPRWVAGFRNREDVVKLFGETKQPS